MSTINSRGDVDSIIRHNGFYGGDDTPAPDNLRVVRVVEYTNMGDVRTWGVIFDGQDLRKYAASEYVRDPVVIWDYLPPDSKCEEASVASHHTYIACGRPAFYMVDNGDPRPYPMCIECAAHNVRNRRARITGREPSAPDPAELR